MSVSPYGESCEAAKYDVTRFGNAIHVTGATIAFGPTGVVSGLKNSRRFESFVFVHGSPQIASWMKPSMYCVHRATSAACFAGSDGKSTTFAGGEKEFIGGARAGSAAA